MISSTLTGSGFTFSPPDSRSARDREHHRVFSLLALVLNPIVGFVKHHKVAQQLLIGMTVPSAAPTETSEEIRVRRSYSFPGAVSVARFSDGTPWFSGVPFSSRFNGGVELDN